MGCWGWQVEYHKSAQPWACTWGPSAEGRDSSPHQSQSLTVQSSGPTVKEQLLLQVEAEACLEKKVSCCAPFHCANFWSCGKATSCHQAADFHSVWKVGNDTSNPQRMGKMKLHLNSCCEGQQWLYTTGSPQGGTSCAWMLPAFSSGEGNSQCPPISTHRWTPASHGCSESGVTLPAGCTNNCQQLCALKPVQRDRGPAQPCVLVSQAVLQGLATLQWHCPRSKAAEGQRPTTSKKAWRRLLPGVHISAWGPLFMFECAWNLWKLGTITEKKRDVSE